MSTRPMHIAFSMYCRPCTNSSIQFTHDLYCGLFTILDLALTVLIPTLKPLYSNTVIGTLAVDGWAVTFGTARRGLGGPGPRPVPSSLYQM